VDILVVRKSGGLGDIICCEPVIRGLRKKYPHAEIIFGMPREFVCLFEGCSEITYKGYGSAELTIHWMRKYEEQYDILLDLHGPATNDEKYGSPPCSRTESFCNYAGVKASCPEIHLTDDEKSAALEVFNEYPKPWIGFGPNGTNWTRNWPKDRWEKLTEETPGTKFYFDKEKESMFDRAIPFVGKSLREVAALISQLDLMISVDTGLLHLAGAVGTRTFSIWGPSDPKRTLKHYPEAYYLDPAPYRAKAGCVSPCLYNPLSCLDVTRPFSKCMEATEADDVITAIASILTDGDESGPVRAEDYETKVEIPKKGQRPRIVWVGKHLIEDPAKIRKWIAETTHTPSTLKEPCSTALQIRHLFGKFITPLGDARRDQLGMRGLLAGKQIPGAASPKECLDEVISSGYLTRPDFRDRCRRAEGDKYAEMVKFVCDGSVSDGPGRILSRLCRRRGCLHQLHRE